tara:strand:+ start:3635 stop:3988 length:354 start_codon:yes stop_codon:yes gene_type:complete
MLVPREEREALGDTLQSLQVDDYMNFTGFCQRILADILSGRVDPSVADAARGWAELMFTSLAAKNASTGTPGHAFIDIITALSESADALPAPEAKYITVQPEEEVIPKTKKKVKVAK